MQYVFISNAHTNDYINWHRLSYRNSTLWHVITKKVEDFWNPGWRQPPSWLSLTLHFWRHRCVLNRSRNIWWWSVTQWRNRGSFLNLRWRQQPFGKVHFRLNSIARNDFLADNFTLKIYFRVVSWQFILEGSLMLIDSRCESADAAQNFLGFLGRKPTESEYEGRRIGKNEE